MQPILNINSYNKIANTSSSLNEYIKLCNNHDNNIINEHPIKCHALKHKYVDSNLKH